jgi:hypothetical protein
MEVVNSFKYLRIILCFDIRLGDSGISIIVDIS